MLQMRIFVSSPGDVVQERVIAQRVIDRLQDEFIQRAAIEPVFWELEPCLASHSFQPQIQRASQADICVILFWSRLGTPVTVEGIEYGSGTEYEFRDALTSFRETGSPSLLIYRKTEQRLISTRERSELSQIIQQQKAVDDFIAQWLRADDGNLRAFHEFETLAQFEERLEEHLRKLIERKLSRAGADMKTRARWSKGSPFRGLAPFEEAHKDIFFGRTAAVHDVLNALRRQAADGRSFLLITGMSGAGKSSLVRAGVLPVLARPGVIEGIAVWRHAVLRPSQPGLQGDGLADGLVTALLREEALPSLADTDLAELFRSNLQSAVTLVKRELDKLAADLQREDGREKAPGARLLLVVDQLEELFIDERISPARRAAFTQILAGLARSGVVWVIATLRSDFYGRITELPDFIALKEGAGHYDLRSPTLAEIALMIRKPAQLANLRFDVRPATGEPLDDVLCAEAAKDPGALPLLQFILEALYERRTPEGLLTFAAYEELGGLEGALARRAEQVFASLSSQAQQALPRVLAAIVRLGTEKDEELVQRRVPVGRITVSPDARALITAFTDKRLFVKDRADDGSPVLGVAHEALLRRWPRVQEWARQNRHLLRARAHIAAALALWSSEGNNREFLLRAGRSLEDGRALLSIYAEALTPDEKAFITSSLAADNRRRQRRLLARLGAAGVAAVLLTCGGLYWFFNARETVEYYASFSNRWGMPEGVGLLSETSVKTRNIAFRFIRRGITGPVERIDVVNGQGRCPAGHYLSNFLYLDLDLNTSGSANIDAYAPNKQNKIAGPLVTDHASSFPSCHWRFKSEGGKAVEEYSFNKDEREGPAVYILKYDGSSAQYTSTNGYALPLLGSGVSNLQFEWVEDGVDKGRIKIVRFRNAHGTPRPDHKGRYGLKFDYNQNGLPVRITNLGRDGRPMRTQEGTAVVTITYDSQDNPVDVAFLDETSRPTRDNVHNVSGVRIAYDDRGNPIRESYFDLRGKPTANKSKTWAVVRHYDERGSLAKLGFLDEKGEKTRNTNGISEISILYNEDGSEAKQVYLDEAGRRIRARSGVAGVELEYDNRGRLNQTKYVDEADQPARHKEGYAIARFTYDNENRLKQLAFMDEEGRLSRNAAGYASLQREFNDTGQLEQEAYRDELGQPVRLAFNDMGQLEQEAFRDELRQPVRLADGGYASVILTYDDRGNVASETYLNENNERARQRKGYAEARRSYDGEGRKIEERFFDEAGRLVRGEDGYAIAKYVYDAQGKKKQEEYFDEEGSPTASQSGYVKISYDHDDRGNETQRDHLYSNEQLGWRVQYEYNDKDEVTHISLWEQISEGQDPVRAQNRDGCSSLRMRYDDSGRETQRDCMSGESPLPYGFYDRTKSSYDEWGNLAERRYFRVSVDGGDEKETEVSTDGGYSAERFSYDSRGNIVEVVYYNNAVKTNTYYGYSMIKLTYDVRGNRIEKSYYDKGGMLVPSVHKAAKIKWKFNQLNQEVERVNLDTVGLPVLNSAGFARMVKVYDDRGRLAQVRFLDNADRPATIARAFATVVYEYDERGNVRDMRYLDQAERSTRLKREVLPRSTATASKCEEVADVQKYAANRGNTDAQNMLGWMYEAGGCVLRDVEEARAWYRRAVALNDTYAMSNLGMMMLRQKEGNNEGRQRQLREAVRLVRRSAESGNPFGQTNWGLLYYRGVVRGTALEENNKQEAMVWFRRAAAQNNGLGQSHLGAMYEEGYGVPKGARKDYQEAERYYKLAAENGEPEGMLNLGLLYLKVKKSDVEGADWLRKAAELGHPAAQANLGFLYARGRGVRNDPYEAIRWYGLALANDEITLEVENKAIANLKALQREWLNATKEMLRQSQAQRGCSARFLEPALAGVKTTWDGCSVAIEELGKQWEKDDQEKDMRKRESIISQRIDLIKKMASAISTFSG